MQEDDIQEGSRRVPKILTSKTLLNLAVLRMPGQEYIWSSNQLISWRKTVHALWDVRDSITRYPYDFNQQNFVAQVRAVYPIDIIHIRAQEMILRRYKQQCPMHWRFQLEPASLQSETISRTLCFQTALIMENHLYSNISLLAINFTREKSLFIGLHLFINLFPRAWGREIQISNTENGKL